MSDSLSLFFFFPFKIGQQNLEGKRVVDGHLNLREITLLGMKNKSYILSLHDQSKFALVSSSSISSSMRFFKLTLIAYLERLQIFDLVMLNYGRCSF